MYAVIRSGGKQYRVREGELLRVDRLAAEVGEKIVFEDVLLFGTGEDIKFGSEAAGTKVSAEVVEQGLGRKIPIFKKRRRKHSKRTHGHRQPYTCLRIVKIGAAKVSRKAGAVKAEPKAAAPVKEPKASAKAAAGKTGKAAATAVPEAKATVATGKAKVRAAKKSAGKE